MRRIAFFILLIVAALTTTAQTHYEGTIAVGGKAGATLSRVNFNPGVQQSMLPGMTFGAMFRYIEEKHFGLIAELNLAQRGWKEAFDDADYSYSHRFTCIELPVMTHIYFGSDRARGFFNLGPELSVMIADGISSNFSYQDAASMDYFIHDTRHIEQMTLNVKNRLDYGICAGTEPQRQALAAARGPFLLWPDGRLPQPQDGHLLQQQFHDDFTHAGLFLPPEIKRQEHSNRTVAVTGVTA